MADNMMRISGRDSRGLAKAIATDANGQIVTKESALYLPRIDNQTHLRLAAQRLRAKNQYLASELLIANGATSGIEQVGTVGTLGTDTTYKEGTTPSIKTVATDVSFQCHLSMGSADMSADTHIRLWIKVDDVSKIHTIKIAFNAPDNNNQFTASLTNAVVHRSGAGCVVSVSKANFTKYGSPTWSDVRKLWIISQATTGNTLTVWWDNITFQRPNVQNGKIILRFDDGYKTHFTEAMPALYDNGLVGSCVINPAFIDKNFGNGTVPCMSMDDLQYLKTLGWDICSHTWRSKSFTNLTYQQAYNDLRATQNYLIENGFGNGARFNVFSGHGLNEETLKAANDLFALDCSGTGGYETLPWGDSNLKWQGGDHKTLSELQVFVDKTAENKALMVLTFHRIEAVNADYYTDPAVRNDLAEYIAAKSGIDCITFSDLYDGTAIALR